MLIPCSFKVAESLSIFSQVRYLTVLNYQHLKSSYAPDAPASEILEEYSGHWETHISAVAKRLPRLLIVKVQMPTIGFSFLLKVVRADEDPTIFDVETLSRERQG